MIRACLKHTTPRAAGFTLVEMMVALFVFALLATAGSAVLLSGLDAKETFAAREASLGRLYVARAIMKADFGQAVDRAVRDPDSGQSLGGFTGGYDLNQERLVSLVRSGWTNPSAALPRADMQFVRYRLEGDVLMRRAYARLDATGDTPYQDRALLAGVEAIEIRYFDGARWSPRWPVSARTGRLPRAVSVELELAETGAVRQVFLVPGGAS